MSNVTLDGMVPWKVNKSKRVGLIDADGVLFAAALDGVTKCDGEQLQLLDDSEVLRRCQERMDTMDAWLGDCPTVFICLSARQNFRYGILESYKGQRKSGDRPITLDALRGAVLDGGLAGYKAVLIDNLEADDVCGILSTKFQAMGYEAVIVSPDKDMRTIPGMLLTPRPGKAPVFSEITPEDANRYHAYQTLAGDTVDNYKGCRGIGPAKAEKIIDAHENDPIGMWEAVVDTFEAKGFTADDALQQARVSRILRAQDWDEVKKEPILFSFPHE